MRRAIFGRSASRRPLALMVGLACSAPLALAASLSACGRLGYDDFLTGESPDGALPEAGHPEAGAQDGGAEVADTSAGNGGEASPGIDDAGLEAEASTVPACPVTCTNAHGTTACVGGACAPTCAVGFADCNGDPNDGCEADLNLDPDHCGTCPMACEVPADAGAPICEAGTCGVSSCGVGLGDCDHQASNGCETNLDTSASNCRFCGNACSFPNAAASCRAGTCQIGACDPNFADCNGAPADGCEADLRATTANCGACGAGCVNTHGTTQCAASACTPTCAAGFGDCDGNARNGCETDLTTPTSCGTCGRSCPANGGVAVCTGGTCGTTCNWSGTYAVKFTVQTSWPASVTRAGSGPMVFWARMSTTQSGTTLPLAIVPCGINVPDFASITGEQYGITYPLPFFDHVPQLVATTSATATLTSSLAGATFTVPAFAILLGATLPNPISDPWPNSPGAVTTVDVDADGQPAVTTPYKSGGTYVNPPLSISGSPVRSDKAYLAARLVASFTGSLPSCGVISGNPTVSNIDTHIVGCEVAGGGNCTSSQSNFLDSARPAFAPVSSVMTVTKVADNATCAVVRSTIP